MCGNYISGWINWVPDSYQTLKSKESSKFWVCSKWQLFWVHSKEKAKSSAWQGWKFIIYHMINFYNTHIKVFSSFIKLSKCKIFFSNHDIQNSIMVFSHFFFFFSHLNKGKYSSGNSQPTTDFSFDIPCDR